LQILKTTQSGFEGYLVDEFTTLKPTKDRVMATKIFCEYHFNSVEDFDKIDFSKIYDAVQQVQVFFLCLTLVGNPNSLFWGSCHWGIFSLCSKNDL
jgi:urate oxidase